jgi:hypothetical protein
MKRNCRRPSWNRIDSGIQARTMKGWLSGMTVIVLIKPLSTKTRRW